MADRWAKGFRGRGADQHRALALDLAPGHVGHEGYALEVAIPASSGDSGPAGCMNNAPARSNHAASYQHFQGNSGGTLARTSVISPEGRFARQIIRTGNRLLWLVPCFLASLRRLLARTSDEDQSSKLSVLPVTASTRRGERACCRRVVFPEALYRGLDLSIAISAHHNRRAVVRQCSSEQGGAYRRPTCQQEAKFQNNCPLVV